MPNSSCCRLNGVFVDADGTEFLKICVVSIPEKGRANKELAALLAKKLKIAKSDCSFVGGEFDRYKKIKIVGETDKLSALLAQWIAGEI